MERSDQLVRVCVSALETVTQDRVLCFILLDDSRGPYVIASEQERFEVFSILADVDWRTIYRQMCREQDSHN